MGEGGGELYQRAVTARYPTCRTLPGKSRVGDMVGLWELVDVE